MASAAGGCCAHIHNSPQIPTEDQFTTIMRDNLMRMSKEDFDILMENLSDKPNYGFIRVRKNLYLLITPRLFRLVVAERVLNSVSRGIAKEIICGLLGSADQV